MHYAMTRCHYVEKYDPHVYVFSGSCIMCHKNVSVDIPAASLYRYHRGEHIQDCMGNLSVADREFLMSGHCADCFAELFPPED